MTPPDSTHIIRYDTGYITRRKAFIPMEAIQKPDTHLVITDSGTEYVYTNQFGQQFLIDLLPKAIAITSPDLDPLAIPSAFDSVKPHDPLPAMSSTGHTDKYKALLQTTGQPSATNSNEAPWDLQVHGAVLFVIILTTAFLCERLNTLYYEVRKDIRMRRAAANIASLRNQETGDR